MSYFSTRGRTITQNTTVTPLTADQLFTGTGVDVSQYASVIVACKTDQAGTLYVDFSIDNTNWDSTLTYSVVAGVNEVHRISITRQYCRVRFLNSSTPQTYLRLQTLVGDQTALTSALNATLQSDNDSASTKAVITGQTDSGDYRYVPVTGEGHLEVAVHSPMLPFGSLHTENLNPVFQQDAVYGVKLSEVNLGSTGTGSVTAVDGSFVVSTGTTVYSQAYLQSRKRVRYRPGQGTVGRFALAFDTPVLSSYQVAGFGHSEDGLYFGYKDTDFGILYSNRGRREVQKLTITTGATSSGNVAITLNGTSTVVGVSGNSSTVRTAYDIARSTYSGWTAVAESSAVYFVADAAGDKTLSFSFSAGSTGSAATFAEMLSGRLTTEVFIPQSQWNGDKMDGTGYSGMTIDPTKKNVYQLGMQYLGAGVLTFQIEAAPDGNNASFVNVHSLLFPNTLSATSFRNPTFPFTAAVYSAGSTTDLTISPQSFAGFVEGNKSFTGPRYAIDSTVTPQNGVDVPILTICNSLMFGGIVNQAIVNITGITGAAKYGNPITFRLVRDAVLIGNPNFRQFSNDSCTLYDIAATGVTYTQDQVTWSGSLGESGEFEKAFADIGNELTLQPGESITLLTRGAGSAGASPLAIGSINIREDH